MFDSGVAGLGLFGVVVRYYCCLLWFMSVADFGWLFGLLFVVGACWVGWVVAVWVLWVVLIVVF